MTVKFFSQHFMLYGGEIDHRIGSKDYPLIAIIPQTLKTNTWLHVAFVHNLEIKKRGEAISYSTVKVTT